jgi:hypothetical protein
MSRVAALWIEFLGGQGLFSGQLRELFQASVARIEHSEIRGSLNSDPDVASLHPGYLLQAFRDSINAEALTSTLHLASVSSFKVKR